MALMPNMVDCLDTGVNISECIDDLKQTQLNPKVSGCLDNCATCVRQWKLGVYNGRSCANDCVQQQEDDLKEALDPDCNMIRYFNATILANLNRE